MRALDFCVDIDDDDLFPPEDLRNSRRQRSGSKGVSHRSGGISGINAFDNNARKSNLGNFLHTDRLI